ncbi:MAG: hypothetical protein KDC66_18440 [Phaeodactylibacter sp.]|nr:hypothetical protein [Phaeodactylibacter sp.]MCB9273065.1 hypothetical protein [Lewinellaceae bacterium]
MKKMVLLFQITLLACSAQAQFLEFGMETVTGPAHTTFKGGLSEMVGFSELEITEAQVDSAFDAFGLDAPRWLKELFPGLRIEIDQEISRKVNRNINGVRMYARLKWVGASFTVSDPRLTDKRESQKLKNQIKSVKLSLKGDAEGLAEHLALLALDDAKAEKPFFSQRYDLEAYVHLKKIFLGERPLAEWGKKRTCTLDAEVTPGLRFSADPSPVVNLGSILFVREKLDSLMEGGLLAPVENTTDQIAEALQSIVFGKFNDPRVVPSFGWFLRAELPVNFGGGFTLVGGAELSAQKNTAIKGTKPMFSAYGFAGLRYIITGKPK